MASPKTGMPWSKLRANIRSFISPELRHRIDFHVTSYRRSHDEAEKAWITVNGKRVQTASWYQHQWHGWPNFRKTWTRNMMKCIDPRNSVNFCGPISTYQSR
jgi:hypothetical protein